MYICPHYTERWPSGLRRTPGKRVDVRASRGFESLPLCNAKILERIVKYSPLPNERYITHVSSV